MAEGNGNGTGKATHTVWAGVNSAVITILVALAAPGAVIIYAQGQSISQLQAMSGAHAVLDEKADATLEHVSVTQGRNVERIASLEADVKSLRTEFDQARTDRIDGLHQEDSDLKETKKDFYASLATYRNERLEIVQEITKRTNELSNKVDDTSRRIDTLQSMVNAIK
jgi:hypothetical protein